MTFFQAVWCFSAFGKFEFKDTEFYMNAVQQCLRLLHDNSLPVKVFAALALKHFAKNPLGMFSNGFSPIFEMILIF